MNLALAILLLSASGSANREMSVDEQTIAGVLLQVGKGAVEDVLGSSKNTVSIADVVARFEDADPRLSIDGRPRSGVRDWGEAGWRTLGYVGDGEHAGSVGYGYQLQLGDMSMSRRTDLSDGRLTLTTDAWWVEVVVIPVPRGLWWLLGKQIIRRLPTYVRITITAIERDVGSTTIVGGAIGTADTSEFTCRLARREAERQAAATLDRELGRLLLGIEQRGTDYYLSASDLGPLLAEIRAGLRTVGQIQLLRGRR